MSGKIVAVLLLGIGAGSLLLPASSSAFLSGSSSYVLYLMLFLIGIDIGTNRSIFRRLPGILKEIAVVTGGTLIGTLLGSFAAAALLGGDYSRIVSAGAGFGWYSLSAVLLGRLDGPDLSSLSFMANCFRELLAFILIPIAAKRLGFLPAVSIPGATSMDTTLGVVREATDDETAVVSLVNGFLLTAVVPVLVPFLYQALK